MSGRVGLGRRWLLAAASVLLVLVMVEVGLRVGGRLLVRMQRAENILSIERGGELVVLCIGESTTALGGVSSYPHLLERELLRRHPAWKISVVNGGLSRASTERLLERLPEQLERYRPHVVVSMMGINDDQWYAQPADAGALGRLSSLRVAMLIRLGLQHLSLRLAGDTSRGEPDSPESLAPWDGRRIDSQMAAEIGRLLESGATDEALDSIRRALAEEPADLTAIMLLDVLTRRHSEGAARELARRNRARLEELLESEPGDSNVRAAIAHAELLDGNPSRAATLVAAGKEEGALPEGALIELASRCSLLATRAIRQSRLEEALDYLETGLAISPESRPTQRAKLRDQIAFVYQQSGRGDEAERVRNEARRLRRSTLDSRTRESYLALQRKLASGGIPLVAVQYPRRSLLALSELLGDAPDVYYVDNEQLFERAVRERGYWTIFSDQFAGDFGHLTRPGNAVLARNVADTLEPLLEAMVPSM